MRDMDHLDRGTRRQRRAAMKRVVAASFWARLFCADLIRRDLDAQLEACVPPRSEGGGGEDLLIRHTLEITRCTGLTASGIYETMSAAEFGALLSHVAWKESVEHSHYAAQSGKGVIIPHPPAARAEEQADIDPGKLHSVLSAWRANPETVH